MDFIIHSPPKKKPADNYR